MPRTAQKRARRLLTLRNLVIRDLLFDSKNASDHVSIPPVDYFLAASAYCANGTRRAPFFRPITLIIEEDADRGLRPLLGFRIGSMQVRDERYPVYGFTDRNPGLLVNSPDTRPQRCHRCQLPRWPECLR